METKGSGATCKRQSGPEVMVNQIIQNRGGCMAHRALTMCEQSVIRRRIFRKSAQVI